MMIVLFTPLLNLWLARVLSQQNKITVNFKLSAPRVRQNPNKGEKRDSSTREKVCPEVSARNLRV